MEKVFINKTSELKADKGISKCQIKDMDKACNRKQLIKNFGEFAQIKKVCGGWLCFDCYDDYKMWVGQK